MEPVKNLSVTVLVDNYIDLLLPGEDRVSRAPLVVDGVFSKNPVSEHGLSLLFDVDGKKFIMDFGLSEFALLYNMEILGLSPSDVEFGILSHGHHDHRGALLKFAEKRQGKAFRLYLHKDALLKERFFRLPDGREAYFPPFETEMLEYLGVQFELVEGPVFLLDGKLAVSGEIPRVTDFEKGLPGAFYVKDGKKIPDPIKDDMSIYFLLEGKGLVVVSGCAHSGIVNSTLYGMEVTGEKKVYAILGGFHLTGPGMEEVVPKTIEKLKELEPEVICPMHCTGWKSQVEIYRNFPEAYVISTPGTRIVL